MKILVIVPAYNEQNNIQLVVEAIKSSSLKPDYIVINDCSTDNTENVLKTINANYINCPVNLGIGGAMQTGYLYAKQNEYDIAVQMDGDGQHDVKYLDILIEPILRGSDISIGSRYINKMGFQSSVFRRIGIKILSQLIRLCFIHKNINILDVTSGFRAVNKKMIRLFAMEYAQDYPEPEAIVLAISEGAIVEEVPVMMNERSSGQSSISGFKTIYYMIKVSLAIIILRISVK